jgi:hypothetical protein
VRISCFNGNVAGLLLYAKLGFAPFAIEPRLGSHEDRTNPPPHPRYAAMTRSSRLSSSGVPCTAMRPPSITYA